MSTLMTEQTSHDHTQMDESHGSSKTDYTCAAHPSICLFLGSNMRKRLRETIFLAVFLSHLPAKLPIATIMLGHFDRVL